MGAIEKKLPSGKSPFLAKAAALRTGEDSIPGYYSPVIDMWVVNVNDGPVPIIAKGALAELLTKTKVNVEQDDETSFGLELMTKTYQKVESDDDCSFRRDQLPQLLTKTGFISERDDHVDTSYLLELITKTNVELERDDNGDPSLGLENRFYKD